MKGGNSSQQCLVPKGQSVGDFIPLLGFRHIENNTCFLARANDRRPQHMFETTNQNVVTPKNHWGLSFEQRIQATKINQPNCYNRNNSHLAPWSFDIFDRLSNLQPRKEKDCQLNTDVRVGNSNITTKSPRKCEQRQIRWVLMFPKIPYITCGYSSMQHVKTEPYVSWSKHSLFCTGWWLSPTPLKTMSLSMGRMTSHI